MSNVNTNKNAFLTPPPKVEWGKVGTFVRFVFLPAFLMGRLPLLPVQVTEVISKGREGKISLARTQTPIKDLWGEM